MRSGCSALGRTELGNQYCAILYSYTTEMQFKVIQVMQPAVMLLTAELLYDALRECLLL